MEIVVLRRLSAFKIFLIGYLVGIPLLLTAYVLTPSEYPVLTLDDLQSSQSKYKVLEFLYTSLLTKITTWYQGMVGCVFGVFSIMALLTERNLPAKVRLIITIVGIFIVCATAFVFFKTISTYTLMCIVEQSYSLNVTKNLNMLHYFQKLNEIANEPFPYLARMSNLTPKDLILVFGGSLAIFIWPAIYVIIALYFHGSEDHKKTKTSDHLRQICVTGNQIYYYL